MNIMHQLLVFKVKHLDLYSMSEFVGMVKIKKVVKEKLSNLFL